MRGDDFAFRVHPPVDEWSLLLETHPNLLLTGPASATDALLATVTPYLRQPICYHRCDTPRIPLPDAGTVILRDVDALDPEGQLTLIRWMNVVGSQTQWVCITSRPLFPLVSEGIFLDTLYYRLNAVYLTVEPLTPHAA